MTTPQTNKPLVSRPVSNNLVLKEKKNNKKTIVTNDEDE